MVACLLGGVVLGGLAGCGKVDSVSVVNSDGGFEKSVKLTLTKNSQMPMGEGSEAPVVAKDLLKAEGEWQGVEEDTQEESTFVIKRSFGKGEKAVYSVLSPAKEILIESESSSLEEADGVVHSEVWTWKGAARTKSYEEAYGKFEVALKQHLSGMKVSDDALAEVLDMLVKRLHRELFGPGDPLLSRVLHAQDLERQFRLRLFKVTKGTLLDRKIGGMSDDKATEIARAVASTIEFDELNVNSSEPPQEESDDMSLISVMVVMKGAGEVLDTNGEVNPLTGDVEWVMYVESPAYEPLKLWAKFKK